MIKTGEMIKNARESKGLSIHEISLNLKINSKVLKAIEEGDVKNLPAKTFLRGFVKSYASYLKMDTDLVLKTFAQEMGTTKPELPLEMPVSVEEKMEMAPKEKQEPKPEPVVEKKTSAAAAVANDPFKNITGGSKKPGNAKPFIYSGVAVVLVIFIVAAKQIIEKYQKESVVDAKSISEVAQTEAQITAVTTPTTIEPIPVTTSTTIAASIETKNINPKPNIPVSLSNTGEIVIQAKKDITLDVRNTGGDKQQIEMKANELHTFRTSVGVEITVSDGSAVDVYVNGRTAGKVSETEKPVKLVY